MSDFSKIGKSNRSRGASYERKIANLLTDGFKIKFKRSPRSGALLREGSINGLFIGGDLVCEKDFMFSIECKNCKDNNIESIIKTPNTAPLIKYWCQCLYDANVSGKLPLMFFHMKSIRKDFVCICDNGLKHLKYNPEIFIKIPSISGPISIDIDNKTVKMENINPMMIFLAEQFPKLAVNVFKGGDSSSE